MKFKSAHFCLIIKSNTKINILLLTNNKNSDKIYFIYLFKYLHSHYNYSKNNYPNNYYFFFHFYLFNIN